MLDQTSPGAAPDYRALRSQQAGSCTTTRARSTTPSGDCPVFQLPVVAFPEEPPPGVDGRLRPPACPTSPPPPAPSWSYGAIRGTARADWQLALPLDDPASLVEDLAAAGFCAVSVDLDGYDGSGTATRASTRAPASCRGRAAGGDERRRAPRGLRPAARFPRGTGTAARDAVLRPVVVSMDGSLVEVEDGQPAAAHRPDGRPCAWPTSARRPWP